VRIIAALAGVALLAYGIAVSYQTQQDLRLIPYLAYDARVDFAYFYGGARMVLDGRAADLYPKKGELTFYPGDPVFPQVTDDSELARLIARGNYYNPPALAFLQSPLALLEFREAFWAFTVLAAGALALLVGLAWREGRWSPLMGLVVLGIAAFRPVHEALIMGHISLFLALALGAGFLALRARQPLLAGVILGTLALKPQWGVLPGVFLLTQREWRAAVAMLLTGALIFWVPFFVTGLHTFENYVEFLRLSTDLDLRDAPHMFSLNGFLFKLRDSEPSRPLLYALMALAGGLLLAVWWRRDLYLGVAATVVGMLLVSTRSVWYDWSLLAVPVLFLALRPASPLLRWQTMGLFLILLVTANQSVAALLYPDRYFIEWHREAVFAITPAAFLVLAWLAAVAFLERPAQGPTAPTAT
jgi:hypothetical protein